MIRVAVVGVGGMGACHARHIHDLAGAEVCWVADPDEQAGRALACDVGACWTSDGFAAIADCDAVVIASPDRFHAGYLDAALAAELAVLCEKPLTADLADAQRIVAHEVSVGRRLVQVGFMRVYDERHIQVSEALTSLGPVNHVRCVHRNTRAEARTVRRILVESIIHDIHTVRWLAQAEIVEVMTTAVQRAGQTRFVLLACRLGNDGVATIEFDDAAAGYEVSVEVSAEHGNVLASEPNRALVRHAGSVSALIGDDWFAPFLETYRLEMRAWLNSVTSSNATGPTVWDGYAAQAVVEAAVASEQSGHPEAVHLDDQPSLYSGVAR